MGKTGRGFKWPLPIQLRHVNGNIVLAAVKSIFQSHLIRRAGENTWKLCDPAILRAKPVDLFGYESWSTAWCELRQQRAQPALELILSLHPGRETNS